MAWLVMERTMPVNATSHSSSKNVVVVVVVVVV